MGEKDVILEALQEQPDWEDPPADRCQVPSLSTQHTVYQLSPTQPVTRRSKASPTVSAQPVQVKSLPYYRKLATETL